MKILEGTRQVFLSENVRRRRQVLLSEKFKKVADRCFLVKSFRRLQTSVS